MSPLVLSPATVLFTLGSYSFSMLREDAGQIAEQLIVWKSAEKLGENLRGSVRAPLQGGR